MGLGDRDFLRGILGAISPTFAARQATAEEVERRRTFEKLMKEETPEIWDENNTKFRELMFLDAKAFQPPRLFDVPPPVKTKPGDKVSSKHFVVCPGNQKWRYMNQ